MRSIWAASRGRGVCGRVDNGQRSGGRQRFSCRDFNVNFALKNSRSAGEIIRSIRNGSRIYLVLNASGLLEARVENTFALQQPAKPAGSNAQNPFNGGWPAYEFDASSIARNSDGSASVSCRRRARRTRRTGCPSSFRMPSISTSRTAFRSPTRTMWICAARRSRRRGMRSGSQLSIRRRACCCLG